MLSRQAAADFCPDDPKAHFGGPDVAPGLLRDLLKARIAATPAHGAIRWAVYYFRDPCLALALMRAADRGVDVRLVVEGAPHHPCANRPVLEALRAHGLGGGLRVLHDGVPVSHPLHMHAKVYAFAHRRGCALVGTYNPLGGDGGGRLESLGDHDRGHNYLVETTDDGAVDALGRYVDRLFGLRHWAGLRRDPEQNAVERTPQIGFHFFPRTRVDLVEAALARLDGGDAAVGCVSHLDDGPAAAALAGAAARGARVSLHLGGRGRRISGRAVRRLRAAGAEVRLYGGPPALPMHCKFLVLRRGGEREALFGSFNLNAGSRWLNHEVLCRSAAPSLVDAFETRFRELRPWAEPAARETAR
jgi:hypothetical protein